MIFFLKVLYMNKKINKTELQLFYNYAIGIGVIWIVLITSSLFWNIITVKKSSVATARIEAHTVFEKDVMYRRWNAMHGGLYAPVTETSQPNPYLTHLCDFLKIKPKKLMFCRISKI